MTAGDMDARLWGAVPSSDSRPVVPVDGGLGPREPTGPTARSKYLPSAPLGQCLRRPWHARSLHGTGAAACMAACCSPAEDLAFVQKCGPWATVRSLPCAHSGACALGRVPRSFVSDPSLPGRLVSRKFQARRGRHPSVQPNDQRRQLLRGHTRGSEGWTGIDSSFPVSGRMRPPSPWTLHRCTPVWAGEPDAIRHLWQPL